MLNGSNIVQSSVRLIPWPLRDKIKRIPLVGPLQRFLVERLLNGREMNHRVDAGPASGICFQIKLPEDKGIWTGTYEVDFATRVAGSLQAGDIAYDIGGWHGFFSGVMAANGAAEVHVFEPLPQNVERIKSMIDLNPAHSITLHECAIGEKDELLDLVVMPQTSMAKLDASPFQSHLKAEERIAVPVRNLDNLVGTGQIGLPDIIKIDVEGAEAFVLKGAIETLRKCRPTIFAEMHSSSLRAECTALLEAEGYVIEALDKDMALAQDTDVFQICARHPARGGK